MCTGTVITVESSIPNEGLGQIEQIVVASITVLALSSISFFIFGLLCGSSCCKQKMAEAHSQERNPNPYQHEELELNPNEAYGPIRQHIY